MHWDQYLFLRALDFAAKAHGPQQVPGSGAPYVVHLAKVASEIAHVAEGIWLSPPLSFPSKFAHLEIQTTCLRGPEVITHRDLVLERIGT